MYILGELKMKGKNPKEMPPNTSIFTCISTCKKGIYESFQMGTKREINHQMPAFDENVMQNMSYSDKGRNE